MCVLPGAGLADYPIFIRKQMVRVLEEVIGSVEGYSCMFNFRSDDLSMCK